MTDHFQIEWKARYLDASHGLKMSDTQGLMNALQNIMVKSTHNGNEIDAVSGAKLCKMIEEDVQSYKEKRARF
jgi:hypothetical protein